MELPTLLDQRCDTIKSVMSSNDSFFAEISELETSEIIKEKKKATITRSHSAFDPPKSWKRRINRYHDERSEKGPIDCRLNEISADESETPRKEESLYVEMIQSGSKLDARSTKNDYVQNILATKGKEDIFSPTRKSIDNGLLGTCSIQLEIDDEENSGTVTVFLVNCFFFKLFLQIFWNLWPFFTTSFEHHLRYQNEDSIISFLGVYSF